MSQHCKSSQIESVCIASSKCIKSQHNVTPTRHETHVGRQKSTSVDSTGVLSCHMTMFECLRHNLLNVRQVQLACDITSLSYCFLDPQLGLAIY